MELKAAIVALCGCLCARCLNMLLWALYAGRFIYIFLFTKYGTVLCYVCNWIKSTNGTIFILTVVEMIHIYVKVSYQSRHDFSYEIDMWIEHFLFIFFFLVRWLFMELACRIWMRVQKWNANFHIFIENWCWYRQLTTDLAVSRFCSFRPSLDAEMENSTRDGHIQKQSRLDDLCLGEQKWQTSTKSWQSVHLHF